MPAQRRIIVPGTNTTVDRSKALADAAARILADRAAQRRSPQARTSDRTNTFTRQDYDLMARDQGANREGMDRRAQTNELARRDAADRQQGIQRGDDGRIARTLTREGGRFRKRQFAEMGQGRDFRARGSRAGELDIAALGDIGLRFSGWVAYMALGGNDRDRAIQVAREHGADATMIRTLGETTIAAGGALVPESVAEDYIELLYAATVYLQGNPMRLEAPNGNLTLPRIATGAAGGWLGENANITKSAPTFDQVRAELRTVGVIVPVSNRLMRHSPQSVEMIVREDCINNASVLIDTAAIRGVGSAHQPRGLRYQAASANVFGQTATTVEGITNDTAKMQRLLEEAKIKFVRPFWIMAPRTRWALMSKRDGNNQLIWAEEMGRGEFQGKPFGVTTSVPTNLGGGTNESELYLTDFVHQVYAEGVGDDALRVTASDGVAYHDGSNVIAAFSQDQTVVRLLQTCDVVSRQAGNETSVLTGVTLGA
jgi:HK97 family phage major capsid protein